MTFLAALRHDRIDAPWVFDGPINAESFRLYVEEVLVAALKPGDIVVLDNLGSHKGKTIRDVIRAAGARLFFLPPYSPDLNPILISTPLSRSSPSSSTCCARPQSAPSRRPGARSVRSLMISHPKNASDIS